MTPNVSVPASASVEDQEQGQGLVKTGHIAPEWPCPCVVRPALPDASLSAWARHNREWIETTLHHHGAILFRGFNIAGRQDLEAFTAAIALELMPYVEGATPRRHLDRNVYTSTEFPAEHAIALHNELSYVLTWPMKLAFVCLVPAQTLGATPIADVRGVYRRIPAAVRDAFVEKGWMLVRNFGDGLSLRWQDAYHAADERALEAYAEQARLTLEWKGGGRLRTRQVRPAVARHPVTGEHVWFNHVAFWHVSSLNPEVREMLVGEFGEDGLPYNTYYGDGTPIDDAIVEELRRAYDAETVAFPWEKGDLLLVDNMLVAHGRQPFTGQRQVIVAMGQPYTRTDF
jgi:alpha-ketoglutarate-dependent taurine dioxygenase